MLPHNLTPERQAELEKYALSIATTIEPEPKRDHSELIRIMARTSIGLQPDIDIVDIPSPADREVLFVMRATRDAIMAAQGRLTEQ